MKKWTKMLAMTLVMVLVFAACTQVPTETVTDDSIPMSDGMDKDMDQTMSNEGPMAPDFKLLDVMGNTVSLADYEGQKVYVKFWASWCSICVSGLPELDMLAGEMNDFKVVTIVSPNFKGEQSEQNFKDWFAKKDTENITVLLDVDGVVASAYEVRGFPTSVYIGSDGVLVKQMPGHTTNEMIKESFESIW